MGKGLKAFILSGTIIMVLVAGLLSVIQKQVDSIKKSGEPVGYAQQVSEVKADLETSADKPMITFQIVDDKEPTSVVMSFERDADGYTEIIVHGNTEDGRPIAIIRPSGQVELAGEPDVAATQFWAAVVRAMPECYRRQ